MIFPLLYHPEWADRPYLEIAQITGVAHGTVGWVFAELPRLGFIAEVGGKALRKSCDVSITTASFHATNFLRWKESKWSWTLSVSGYMTRVPAILSKRFVKELDESGFVKML